MNAKIIILLGLAALAAADSRESRGYGVPQNSFESSFESSFEPSSFESRSFESRSFESRSFESRSSESYESDEAKYEFNWAVDDDSSENHYSQQEARDGDQTQGSYYVALPDSRRQKVTYYVDGDDGYVADVTYSGEARFDSGSYESGSSESYESGSSESRETYRPPQSRYGSNESK